MFMTKNVTIKDYASRTHKPALSPIPSKLLTQVCKDVKWATWHKNIKFTMSLWVLATEQTCYVCLAGVTLLRRPMVSDSHNVTLDDIYNYDPILGDKLQAINDFRLGQFRSFLQRCQDAAIEENSVNTRLPWKDGMVVLDEQTVYAVHGAPTSAELNEWLAKTKNVIAALESIGL
jgi:hypothetical protein